MILDPTTARLLARRTMTEREQEAVERRLARRVRRTVAVPSDTPRRPREAWPWRRTTPAHQA